MLAKLEAYAAHYGCAADTLQGWFIRAYYQAAASRYAEWLSDCAQAFFGV